MKKFTLASAGILLVTAGLAATGTLVLPTTQAFAATCAQNATAWIATPNGSIGGNSTVTLADFTKVFPVGIAQPNTKIAYTVQEEDGSNVAFSVNGQVMRTVDSVNAAGDNCVVDQPNASQAPELVGTGPAQITASYVDWRTDAPATITLGTVIMHL